MNAKMIAALGYSAVTIDPSLRLYVPFNEGIGNVAKDYSQYGNNCALTDIKWGLGGGGNAGIFNGTSSSGNCGNDPSLNITDALSVEAWVKPTGSGWRGIIGEAGDNYAIFLNGYNDKLCYWKAAEILIGNTLLINGEWYHIVMTYDGTTTTFYLNGVYDNSAVVDGSFTVQYIGCDIPTNESFNGTIDEVRIYDRARSAAEILAYYNATKARYT